MQQNKPLYTHKTMNSQKAKRLQHFYEIARWTVIFLVVTTLIGLALI